VQQEVQDLKEQLELLVQPAQLGHREQQDLAQQALQVFEATNILQHQLIA
jgi:hypothetical protein